MKNQVSLCQYRRQAGTKNHKGVYYEKSRAKIFTSQ